MKIKQRRTRIIAVIMAIVMTLSSLSGCSFQKESKDPTSQETTTVDAAESSSDPEVTPESTPSPITRLTNVFQADENSTYYEIKFALPENMTKEEADTITLPKTMTIPEGSLLYSVQGAQKDDYSFNGWYYDAALTQRADGGDVVDHNMTLYPSFVPLQNFDDEVRINYISALDVEPDFKIEVIAFGLTEDEVRERIKVTNLSKVNGAEEFVLERVGSDVAGNAESTKINEILKRVEKAGYDVTSVKISQLTKLLTKDDFAQLGLSMPTAYDSEVDATINLKSIISYDEADLPQTHYIVRPAGNRWNRGDMHQVEILNTDGLRYYRDNEVIGQYVIYYNITVHQDNFNNMRLASGMIFLPIKEVSGVSMDRGLFRVKGNTDGEMSVSENDDSGILTYSGTKEIHAGDTVAVYDGKLKSSGAVDGSVGYFKITEVLGSGKYAYEGADYKDVVFVPDMIPVKNDGSFKDGKILITKDQLDFSGDIYQTLGLSKDTVVEAGDFLVIYNGDLSKADSIALVGYGCVTSVQSAEDGLQVRYDVVSEEKVKESADMYMHMDNVDLQLTEEQLQEISRVFEDDMRDSGFAEKASQYMCDIITLGDDAILPDSTYADSLTEIKFQRADGSEISLEEVRELAGSGRVSVELPPKLYFGPSLGLQHFDGQTGLRLEASVEVEVTIELNESGVIKINAVALLEVEFALGLSIKFETDWRMWYCFPYIYDIGGHVGLTAGVYVGFGVTVTIQTQGKDDDDDDPDDALDEFASNKDLDDDKKKDFGGKISNLGKGLSSIAKMSKLGSDGLGLSVIPGTKTEKSKKEHVKTGKESNGEDTQDGHNSVGGSFEEKYANFLQDSNAEYVDLVRRNLLSVELGSDPFHILVLELDINLVVSFKLNVMLGASITYGNAKQISADFTIFHPGAESTVGDLETPNFQADFFIFGNIGIRVGLEFELRVGAISAKLCSLGVTAEIGVYVEFFGYFYVAFKWESGKGSSTEMFGSMLLELGLYLDIGFRAQLGNGKLQKDIDIYNVRFPLLSLGTEYTPLDFDIEEDSEDLVLDIQKGGSIQVPDELFDIQFLKISTGDISTDNMDRTMSVYNKDNTPFVSNGLTLRQSDEQYFHITFKPLGENYAEPTEKDKLKGGFLYNPEDNKIYAKPSSETTDELWGEFTFKWYQGGPAKTDALLNYGAGFGLNTREISRTVYVHWKGIPTVTKANLYFINEAGKQEASKVSDLGEMLTVVYLLGKENHYYDLKESIDFHGFDGVAYYLDVQKLADAYPGYRIGMSKETYNEEAVDYYLKRAAQGDSHVILEIFRALIYDAEVVKGDPTSRGWRWVIPQDPYLFFMMHAPSTEVDLYLDEATTEVDWYVLDDELGVGKVLAFSGAQKLNTGEKALDHIPANIQAQIEKDSKANDYVWFSYTTNKSNYQNARDKDTGMPVEKRYDGTDVSTNMPMLSEIVEDADRCVTVNEYSTVPIAETVYYAVRVPKGFEITWKYDDGEKTSYAHAGTKIQSPFDEPSRANCDFNGWNDVNGKRVTTMPAEDITLYPDFSFQLRDVNWVCGGQTTTTKIPYGDRIVDHVPFVKMDGHDVKWYTTDDFTKQNDSTLLSADDFVYSEFGETITISGNRLFTATFVNDGAVIDKKDAYENEIIWMPDLHKNGYALSWIYNGSRKLTVSGMYMPGCDVTFTASWDECTYNFRLLKVMDDNWWYPTELSNFTVKAAGVKASDYLGDLIQANSQDRRYTYKLYRYNSLTNYEILKYYNTSNWTPVTEDDLLPYGNATYILMCERHRVNVTWKYADGDVVTSEWLGNPLVAPSDYYSQGMIITGWADADGNTYEYPPEHDLVLYPQLVEHEHEWSEGYVMLTPDCENAGRREYFCQTCHKVRTEVIEPLGHNYVLSDDVTPVSCTDCGYYHYYCTKCYKTKDEAFGQATGHLAGAAVQEDYTAATCTESGGYNMVVYCQHCGEMLSSQHTFLEKLGHDISGVTTDPTCVDQGYTTYSCSRCDYSYVSDYVDAIGGNHSLGEQFTTLPYPIMEGEEGSEECVGWHVGEKYRICSTCHAKVVEETIKVVPKLLGGYSGDGEGLTLPIDLFWKEGTSEFEDEKTLKDYEDLLFFFWASATSVGMGSVDRHDVRAQLTWKDDTIATSDLKVGDTLTICVQPTEDLDIYEAFEAEVTLTEHVHWLDMTEAKAKTCTEDGNSAYWTCYTCGKYFSDEDGLNEIQEGAWTIKAPGHDWDKWQQTKVPTEYETGLKVRQCKNCTATQEETIPALGHTHVLVKTDAKPRTCTEDGNSAYWSCSGCGLYFRDENGQNVIEKDSWIIYAQGHVMTHHDAKPVTCTEEGWGEYDTCENCSYSTLVKIGALGHEMTHHVTKAKTCTEDGNSEYWSCSRCRLFFSDEKGKNAIPEKSWVINAGHELTHHEAKAKTCTENGNSEYWSCKDCGLYFSDAEGKTQIQEGSWILNAGHVLEHYEAQAPTCTKEGWEAYDACKNCSYSTQVKTSALGHDMTAHAAKAKTCTENGNSAYWSCSRCGLYFSDKDGQNAILENSWVDEAQGHVLTHHDKKESSCTEAGNDEYWSCSVCKQFFSDEACQNAIEKDSWVKPAQGHLHDVIDTTEPRFITEEDEDGIHVVRWEVGKKTTKCSRCGETMKVEDIKVTPTLMNESENPLTLAIDNFWKEGTDELEDGKTLKDYEWILDFYWTVAESNGIEPMEWYRVAAELTWKDDTIEVSKLKVGDTLTVCIQPTEETEVFAASEVEITLTAHEHWFEDYTDITEATCTTPGSKTEVCIICGAIGETIVIPVDTEAHDWNKPTYTWSEDHTSVTAQRTCKHNAEHIETETAAASGVISVEPTCLGMGKTKYTSAEFVNAAFTVQEIEVQDIPARGHIWDEWQQTTAPTEYETGLKVRGCKNCTATEEETIPALGHHHVLVKTDAKARTCTENGNTVYWTCKGCGLYFRDENGQNVIEKDSWVIKAQGHVLTHHDAKPVTCTEEGWGEYDTCENCSYSTLVKIGALGHEMTHHAAKAKTCTEDGNTEYWSCSRCRLYFSDEDGQNAIPEKSWVINAGHELTHFEAQAVTCTKEGWEAYDACENCEYTTKVTIDPLGHLHDVINETKPYAVMIDDVAHWHVGKKTTKCSRCGNTVEEEDIKVPLTLLNEVGDPLTLCIDTFWKEGTSELEEGLTLADYELLGHFWASATSNGSGSPDRHDVISELTWKDGDKPVSGLKVGEKLTVCIQPTEDTDIYAVSEVEITLTAHEHWFEEYTDVTEATCTTPGSKTEVCTLCGAKGETIEIPVDPDAHDWGKATYSWNASHTEVTARRECKHNAEHFETETVTASGAVSEAPTCLGMGKTKYTSAGFTNSAFEVQEIEVQDIAALGHVWGEWQVAKAPTESEEGLQTRQCSSCQATEEQVIAKLTHVHVLEKTEAKAATCTEDGNDAYWTCKGCGLFFSDAEGKTGIQENSWVQEKQGHLADKIEVVDPYPIMVNGENGPQAEGWHVGTKTTYCSRCGDKLKEETIKVKTTLGGEGEKNEDGNFLLSISMLDGLKEDNEADTIKNYEDFINGQYWVEVADIEKPEHEWRPMAEFELTAEAKNVINSGIGVGNALKIYAKMTEPEIYEDFYADIIIAEPLSEEPAEAGLPPA